MDHDSHILITDLIIDYDIDLNLTDTADVNDPAYINAFNGFFAGTQTLDISGSNLSFEKEKFDGSGNASDDFGILVAAIDGLTVVNSSSSSTETLFFWDGTGAPLSENGWEVCPVSSGDEEDCALNSAGTAFVPFTNWDDHADVKIRRVILQWNLDAEFAIEFNYSVAGSTFSYAAPTGAANASFTTTRVPASVTVLPVDVNSSLPDTADFIDAVITSCEQDNDVGSEFNIFAYFNDDAGSAFCSPTLVSAVTVNQLDITADYYPELPLWVSQNNWNNSILMTYADEYRPGGTNSCTPEDGDTSTGAADDCIVLNNAGGINNNIVSLLVIAGEHDFVDEGADNFSNDLHDIFETENYSGIGPYPSPNNDPDPASDTGLRLVFDNREDSVDGNSTDTILILELL